MNRQSVALTLKRTTAILQAFALVVAALLPAVLLGNKSSAAQLTSRYVDLSSVTSSGGVSTEGSGRDSGDVRGQDVTYTIGFTVATTGNIGGLVVDFCNDSPITGLTCTQPTGFALDDDGTFNPGAGADSVNLAIANQTGITDFSIDTANTTNRTLVLTRTAASVSASTAVEFDLGTTAAGDGIYNPSVNGTFYARILTFATAGAAQSYSDTAPGSFVDDGGVAMAIANELTVTARVQEVLQFCIGTEESSEGAGFSDAPADTCTNVAGTNLDLGVVDSNSIQTTNDTDIGATNSDGNNGLAMVRTNALNGAVMYYKAEQEAGITNGPGTLKQAGVECSGTITDTDDVCFNSAGATQAAMSAGTELFGMSLRELSTASGTTTSNLSCNANYDGDGSCGAGGATGYAWQPNGSFSTIASASGPTDDETVRVIFAATAAATTPTGLYSVTANFVTTSTF